MNVYPPSGARLKVEVVFAGSLAAGESREFTAPGIYYVAASVMSSTAIVWDILGPDGTALLSSLTINSTTVAIGGGYRLRVRNAGTSSYTVYVARWVVE